MLKLMMELKGKFPNKMLRKGQFANQHFDDDLNFLCHETDRISNKVGTVQLCVCIFFYDCICSPKFAY
jgi:hypothetical protein